MFVSMRWCSPHKQMGRIDYVATASEAMLRSLFSMLPEAFTLDVVAPSTRIRTTPFSFDGFPRLRLKVSKQIVAIEGMFEQAPDLWFAAFGSPEQDLAELSLFDLLMSSPCLRCMNSSEIGALDQLLYQLAALLEPALLGLSPYEMRLDSRWPTRSHLQLSAGVIDVHCRQQQLVAYDMATTQACRSRSGLILSIAVDDSRVGRKNWKLVVGQDLLSNVAWWFCPQAFLKVLCRYTCATNSSLDPFSP